MALSVEIASLRDRALAELIEAHDYYSDSKTAWKILRREVKKGRKFKTKSRTTGTVANQDTLALKARGYVAKQITEATFLQFVATFEAFFFDLLRLWLTAHPQSLANKDLSYRIVLESLDKDAITLEVVNKELNEIAYKRPAEWFAYLESRAKLGCSTPDMIERLTEIKASRDIIAHNRGIVNRIYEVKAGQLARAPLDERLVITDAYHRSSWELLRQLVATLSNAAIGKSS